MNTTKIEALAKLEPSRPKKSFSLRKDTAATLRVRTAIRAGSADVQPQRDGGD